MNRPDAERRPNFAPPGSSIGAVWVVLFAGLGAARWFALTSGSPHARDDARAVVGFIALCVAYPFYTHAAGHIAELVGNIVTFAYAAWLVHRLRGRSSVATLVVSAVALWVAFATVLVLALIRLNGWGT